MKHKTNMETNSNETTMAKNIKWTSNEMANIVFLFSL